MTAPAPEAGFDADPVAFHDERVVPGADLQNVDLSGVDLSGRDLSGCNLRGANLSRTNLRGANLMNADATGAALLGADLSSATCVATDFTQADLSDATAVETVFGSARMVDAVLFGATLRGATFTQADLTNADLRVATLTGGRFREATLVGADFSKASADGIDLTGASVEHAVFVDTDLRGAALRRTRGYEDANWIGVDITGADFAGAYLARRAIVDQNYLHEFRNRSRWTAIAYRIWWATSDCGRSFSRWAAWTALLAVVFAAIYSRLPIDYGDYETALSPLYFSVVTLTTLGYGDVLPASMLSQAMVLVEVVLGYVMLGGLLSIFATKMGRRGE